MSVLEKNTFGPERLDKKVIKLEFKPASNSKKNEMEAILDSAIYANKAKDHLPGLYHLVAWKKYPEEENT